MRPLTEDELKIFFEKLAKYIGQGIKALVDRPDGRYCFRLHRDRVYYVGEHQARSARSHPARCGLPWRVPLPHFKS